MTPFIHPIYMFGVQSGFMQATQTHPHFRFVSLDMVACDETRDGLRKWERYHLAALPTEYHILKKTESQSLRSVLFPGDENFIRLHFKAQLKLRVTHWNIFGQWPTQWCLDASNPFVWMHWNSQNNAPFLLMLELDYNSHVYTGGGRSVWISDVPISGFTCISFRYRVFQFTQAVNGLPQ